MRCRRLSSLARRAVALDNLVARACSFSTRRRYRFCSACGIGICSKARFFQEDLDFSLKFAVALARLLDARGPDRFVLMMQRLAQWRLVGLRQAKFPEPHEHREVAAHRQFVDLAPQAMFRRSCPFRIALSKRRQRIASSHPRMPAISEFGQPIIASCSTCKGSIFFRGLAMVNAPKSRT